MKIDKAINTAFDYFVKNGCQPMSATEIARIGGYHKRSIQKVELDAINKIRDQLNISPANGFSKINS